MYSWYLKMVIQNISRLEIGMVHYTDLPTSVFRPDCYKNLVTGKEADSPQIRFPFLNFSHIKISGMVFGINTKEKIVLNSK